MKIIALEGPSCTGKSTTLRYLLDALKPTGARVLSFPCYSDALDSDGPAARPPNTAEQLDAFATFMRVEQIRVDTLTQATPQPDLVILDRSVDTLLAHCKAVDLATGSSSYANAQRLLATLSYLAPDLTIYFDCPPEEIARRAKHERASLDEFFLDSAFLQNFPEHFNGSEGIITCAIKHIDATQSHAAITSKIVNMIISMLGNRDATKLQ